MSKTLRPAKPAAAAVEALELSHSFGAQLAVDRLSFNVPQGAIFGLIGPNGAGKTTTLKMLSTLIPPASGTAIINGYDLLLQPQEVRQSVGYVPQLLNANGELTGYENLLFSAKHHGLSDKDRERRIHDVMEFMDLSAVGEKLLGNYSGGMIRRLEIAQALIHKPSILFLDEPTVGLDPAARKMLWSQIQDLNKKLGLTILMTTHDIDEAEKLCNVVALMHLGRIILMDTPCQLKAAVGPKATLNDAFMAHTGISLRETGDYRNVRQTRRTRGGH